MNPGVVAERRSSENVTGKPRNKDFLPRLQCIEEFILAAAYLGAHAKERVFSEFFFLPSPFLLGEIHRFFQMPLRKYCFSINGFDFKDQALPANRPIGLITFVLLV